MIKEFKSIREMVEAIKRGEVPSDVVSPGAAAAALGVTRHAIYQRIKWKSLDAYMADGTILIDAKMLRKAVKEKRNIPESQGELYAQT